MIQEVANITIDGQPQAALLPDLMHLEVQEAVDAGDVFRLRLALHPSADGGWPLLDDGIVALWKRLAVEGGFPDDVVSLIDGYITHIEVNLGEGDDDCFLDVTGMDASALMDLEDKQVAWPNKKDSEIAGEIFGAYGLSYEVEDTVVQRRDAVSTILQADTDIRFLRRLAARNGFECYVKGSTGFFRSPNLQEPPQSLLAIQFGAETNLARLRFAVDGTAPTEAAARRLDPLSKKEEQAQLRGSPRRRLGRSGLEDLQVGTPTARRIAKQRPMASSAEMEAGLRQLLEPASAFVVVEGEIDARTYGRVLRAKRLVTIKGASATLSGTYYVTAVRHRFDLDGYTQEFRGYRNALGLAGDERFAAPSLPLAIVPGAGGASVSTGNRVLPAQQTQSKLQGGF